MHQFREGFRFFNNGERINEVADDRVFRIDSCVYYVSASSDTFPICDSLFDYSGAKFLFGGYTDEFVLLHARGHKFLSSLLVSNVLWELEKQLPYVTRFSPNGQLLFSSELPMHYGNLAGETFFGQFGRFYIHSVEGQNVVKKFDSFRVLKSNSDSTLLSLISFPFFVSDDELFAVIRLFDSGELNFDKSYCVRLEFK